MSYEWKSNTKIRRSHRERHNQRTSPETINVIWWSQTQLWWNGVGAVSTWRPMTQWFGGWKFRYNQWHYCGGMAEVNLVALVACRHVVYVHPSANRSSRNSKSLWSSELAKDIRLWEFEKRGTIDKSATSKQQSSLPSVRVLVVGTIEYKTNDRLHAHTVTQEQTRKKKQSYDIQLWRQDQVLTMSTIMRMKSRWTMTQSLALEQLNRKISCRRPIAIYLWSIVYCSCEAKYHLHSSEASS